MIRKIIFSIGMAVEVLLLVILTGEASASVEPVPGYSGSRGYILADLSSAVSNRSAKYEITIAVKTKRVDKSGKEIDTGVWYFRYSAPKGAMEPVDCRIKRNIDKEYMPYRVPGANYFCEDITFAAAQNAGGKSYKWAKEYLNGDYNYPLVTTASGCELYLDISSVKVTKYEPPNYQITGELYAVNRTGYGGNFRREVTHDYNYDLHKSWFYDKSGKYYEVHPFENSMTSRTNRKIANALFRCLYGMPFYRWQD